MGGGGKACAHSAHHIPCRISSSCHIPCTVSSSHQVPCHGSSSDSVTEALAAVREMLLLTCRELLPHQGVCQGGLAGSQEVGEANGFHLDCTAGGVPHAADQLGNAAGVALQHRVKGLRPVAYKGQHSITQIKHANLIQTNFIPFPPPPLKQSISIHSFLPSFHHFVLFHRSSPPPSIGSSIHSYLHSFVKVHWLQGPATAI